MIALTSIAPHHFHEGIQIECIRTWIDNGLKVFSFNCKEEVEVLTPIYPDVTFIKTERTFQHHFGKPYVAVNALLDWAKEQDEEEIVIINADIFLINAGEVMRKYFDNFGFAYAHRIDVAEVSPVSERQTVFVWGMDVFLLKKSILNIFPQSLFAIGQTHWDYWLPFVARKEGVKFAEISEPFAYHKDHKRQWKFQAYYRMSQLCCWATNYVGIRPPDPNKLKADSQHNNSYMYEFIKGRINQPVTKTI